MKTIKNSLSDTTKQLDNDNIPQISITEQLKDALRLLRFTKGYGIHYFLMFLFLILQLVTFQGLAYSLKFLINKIFPLGEVKYFLMFAGAWTLLFIVHGIVTLLSTHSRIILVRNLVANVRGELIKKLQILSIKYFDEHGTGSTSAKVLMDMDKVQQFYELMLMQPIQAVLGIIIAVPLLTSIDPILAIVAFVYIPLIPLIQRAFRKKLVKNSYLLRQSNEKLSSKIVDYISGIRLIRMFAAEDERSSEILEEVCRVKKQDIHYTMIMNILGMTVQFFFDFTPVALWITAGILMMKNDKLTIGGVVAYVAIVRLFLQNFHMLFASFDGIVKAIPSVMSINEIIDSDKIENQDPKIKDFSIDGSVSIRNIDFKYKTHRKETQLTNINMDIKAGEKIAFIGTSGSGKTTLLNAIMGLYPIQKGSIHYGEYNINDISLKKLRSQIAFMTQETFLFNISLYENIRFSNIFASKEDVYEACKKAEIYDFIQSLPDGFDTNTGERGVQLSGGQRQRIGLARVFLRDPKIIILDEPSSALDVFTEKTLFDTLYKNSDGKTLIIIAHRISTIKGVDRIFLFENGKIVDQGNYNELHDRNKTFSQMVSLSSGIAD